MTTTERYLHARSAGELADRFTRALTGSICSWRAHGAGPEHAKARPRTPRGAGPWLLARVAPGAQLGSGTPLHAGTYRCLTYLPHVLEAASPSAPRGWRIGASPSVSSHGATVSVRTPNATRNTSTGTARGARPGTGNLRLHLVRLG